MFKVPQKTKGNEVPSLVTKLLPPASFLKGMRLDNPVLAVGWLVVIAGHCFVPLEQGSSFPVSGPVLSLARL